MGLVAGKGLDKGAVNYRQYEKCSTCDHFWSNSGTCDIVDGRVSPEAVCDKWEIKEQRAAEGKDGAFYQKQFEKSKKQ